MANNVIPIFAARIDAEARRRILKEAYEAAEARLRSFDCGDDSNLQDTVSLLADYLWRLPFFAAETKFAAECLHTLRYIAAEFEMTPRNLRALRICCDIVDDRYRDAVRWR